MHSGCVGVMTIQLTELHLTDKRWQVSDSAQLDRSCSEHC